MLSPTKIAIEEFSKIDNLIEKIYSIDREKLNKCCSAFRSRARSTLSQIVDLGLPSTILFIYSKCEKEIFSLLNENKINELGKKEPLKVAYGLYLLLIKDILKDRLGMVSQEDPLNFSKELLADKVKLSLATASLLKILIEVKKIAEAVYKEETGRER
ncbi:MAG: type III-B CRISPR module-associated protein Cmr5 [Thermoprotei archaeon]|nr:MAG: type III-B CRISPR module-associated protein Cmr5 [Thermoprotei archaeon]